MNQSQRILNELTINEPAGLIASFASKSGKSEAEVEKLWDKAKESVKKAHPDYEGDRYYQAVTGTLKKMLGLD